MKKVKNWIKAARLKTLPLSLSGVIVGNLASIVPDRKFSFFVFLMALLTAILLQILSNFANDYGDGIKGTDKNRKGPQRMLQASLISPKKMKKAVVTFAMFSLFSAFILIFAALGFENTRGFLFFMLLSFFGIWAALRYTIGKKAYGYSGFGDIFVFIFFGLVSVLGSYFLQTQTFEIILLLPAIFVGCMSVAVLNLNNIRDYETDKIAKKNTLVVKMGFKKAKIYHFFLIIFAFASLIFFKILLGENTNTLFVIIPFFFLVLTENFFLLYGKQKNASFNKVLGELSFATFICAVMAL